MPGHYGRSSSGGSRGSAAPGGTGGGGGGWSPGVGGQQHQPKAKAAPVSTGGGRSAALQTIAASSAKKALPPQLGGSGTAAQAAQFTGTGAGLPPQLGGSGTAAQAAQFTPQKGRRNIGITDTNKFKKWIAKNKYKIEPWEENAGNLFQIVANMPKYWNLPSGITSLIKSGAEIPFAHGFKTKQAMEAAKKFGFDASRFKNIPTTSEIEAAIKTKSLKALKKAEGVFGATGKKMSDALESAVQYAKGAGTRGVGAAGDLGQVLSGKLKAGMGYVDRGLLGNIQARFPAGVVNKALNLGPESAQVAGKPITQSAINKFGARALPGANIALGGASALGHIQKGNYGQAAMAGLSMIPGPVGYAGLAGEMILGAPSMKEQGLGSYTGPMVRRANGGLADLYRYGGFSG